MVLRACGLVGQLIKATLLLVLCLCAVEVGVRAWEMYAPKQAPLPTSGLASLIHPSGTLYQELVPLAKTNWSSEFHPDVPFRTNSFGGRGAEPATTPAASSYRILWLGDETILSPDLLEEESPTAQLQDRLGAGPSAKVEILNGGLPGSCPLLATLAYQHRWAGVRPQLVLVHVDMTDVADDQHLRRYVFLGPDQSPLCCRHPSMNFSRLGAVAQDWRQRWRVADLMVVWTAQFWKESIEHQEVDWRTAKPYAWFEERDRRSLTRTMAPLAWLRQQLESQGIGLVLVTSAKPWQLSNTAGANSPERRAAGTAMKSSRNAFKQIAAACEELELPLIDTSVLFPTGEEADELFAERSDHFSAAGAARYAEVVGQVLRERWPGPWQP